MGTLIAGALIATDEDVGDVVTFTVGPVAGFTGVFPFTVSAGVLAGGWASDGIRWASELWGVIAWRCSFEPWCICGHPCALMCGAALRCSWDVRLP